MASDRAIAIQTERNHQRVMVLVGLLAQSYHLNDYLERLQQFNPNRLPGPQRMLKEQEMMIGILERIADAAGQEVTPEFIAVNALPPSRRKRAATVMED